MKNVLYIALFAPTDNANGAGQKTLNYYIKNMAAQADCNIDLIAFCPWKDKDLMDAGKAGIHTHFAWRYSAKEEFWGNCRSIVSKFYPFHKYANIMTINARDILLSRAKELKNKGYEPDVVILEWTQVVLLIEDVKAIFPNAKYIASEHDVSFLGFERQYKSLSGFKKYWMKLRYHNLKKRELEALHKCDLVIPHNSKDKNLLVKNGIPTDKCHVIVPYYMQLNVERLEKPQPEIVFFGAMYRPENYLSAIWFIENVLPKLPSNIKFIVLGGKPHSQLLEYACDNVIITGFVDDITPYLNRCLCMVAPLVLGAGIKVKVLEAFAAGVPLITNMIGIEGIPGQSGVNYIHCESADDYVKSINEIIKGTVDTYKISTAAKQTVEKYFNLQESFVKYKKKIMEI